MVTFICSGLLALTVVISTPLEPAALPWPPPYVIRHSRRARRIFLQFSLQQGLEIVVPWRRKHFDAVSLLNEKRAWIEKTYAKIGPRFLQSNPHFEEFVTRPSFIELKALAQHWAIHYIALPNAKRLRLMETVSPPTLTIQGPLGSWPAIHALLLRWLIKQAHLSLVPWLQHLSAETGLFFHRALIRGQTTLWGSCNAHKTISLNYKLLFLPKALAIHVLLHELCHTQHLHHGTPFWALLSRFDPLMHVHKKALKNAETYLPAWILKPKNVS